MNTFFARHVQDIEVLKNIKETILFITHILHSLYLRTFFLVLFIRAAGQLFFVLPYYAVSSYKLCNYNTNFVIETCHYRTTLR